MIPVAPFLFNKIHWTKCQTQKGSEDHVVQTFRFTAGDLAVLGGGVLGPRSHNETWDWVS